MIKRTISISETELASIRKMYDLWQTMWHSAAHQAILRGLIKHAESGGFKHREFAGKNRSGETLGVLALRENSAEDLRKIAPYISFGGVGISGNGALFELLIACGGRVITKADF
ncbi:hypothetical protein EBR96_08640, partial [bacterium]|nr:hypothetical protein [bacterium]